MDVPEIRLPQTLGNSTPKSPQRPGMAPLTPIKQFSPLPRHSSGSSDRFKSRPRVGSPPISRSESPPKQRSQTFRPPGSAFQGKAPAGGARSFQPAPTTPKSLKQQSHTDKHAAAASQSFSGREAVFCNRSTSPSPRTPGGHTNSVKQPMHGKGRCASGKKSERTTSVEKNNLKERHSEATAKAKEERLGSQQRLKEKRRHASDTKVRAKEEQMAAEMRALWDYLASEVTVRAEEEGVASEKVSLDWESAMSEEQQRAAEQQKLAAEVATRAQVEQMIAQNESLLEGFVAEAVARMAASQRAAEEKAAAEAAATAEEDRVAAERQIMAEWRLWSTTPRDSSKEELRGCSKFMTKAKAAKDVFADKKMEKVGSTAKVASQADKTESRAQPAAKTDKEVTAAQIRVREEMHQLMEALGTAAKAPNFTSSPLSIEQAKMNKAGLDAVSFSMLDYTIGG